MPVDTPSLAEEAVVATVLNEKIRTGTASRRSGLRGRTTGARVACDVTKSSEGTVMVM